MSVSKNASRISRARRTHAKARAAGRPRLLVFRSLRGMYAHLVDDVQGKIICGASSLKGAVGIKGAEEVGRKVAELAKAKGVEEVVFDRNGYRYHGKVKALADAAREGGLKF